MIPFKRHLVVPAKFTRNIYAYKDLDLSLIDNTTFTRIDYPLFWQLNVYSGLHVLIWIFRPRERTLSRET